MMSDTTKSATEKPVALVVGGGGAIGGAIAAALAGEGLRVVVAGRRAAEQAASGVAEAIAMDVGDAQQVADGFEQLLSRYGRLDLLVNGAGILTKMSLLLRMKPEEWDQQHAVHSRGAFLASQQAAKIMRKQRQGRIVNIASVAADAPVVPGYSGYAAAKAGMVSLTKSLNMELNGYGVQATAVCPTYVDSPTWEQSGMDKAKMLQPEDVAAAVLFLWRLPSRVRVESLELETPVAGRE